MNVRQLRREVTRLKADALARFPPRPTRDPLELIRQLRELAQRGRDRWEAMTPEQREEFRKRNPPTPESERLKAELIKIRDRRG